VTKVGDMRHEEPGRDQYASSVVIERDCSNNAQEDEEFLYKHDVLRRDS
jgi:hypothetical protein